MLSLFQKNFEKKKLPVLSRDRFEPCRDGGLLPGRLPVREAGREFGREPPGVNVERYDGRRGVRNDILSLSDRESGVPADRDDFD